MKKLIFAAAIVCAAMITSCANKQTTGVAEEADTSEVVVDTTAVDTVKVEGETTEVVEETVEADEADVTGAARK